MAYTVFSFKNRQQTLSRSGETSPSNDPGANKPAKSAPHNNYPGNHSNSKLLKPPK